MKYLEACKFTELLQEYADQYHLYRMAEYETGYCRSTGSKVDNLKEQIWKSLNVDNEV